MKGFITLLSIGLLCSIIYNIITIKSADKRALDEYSHLRYSFTLHEGYEQSIMLKLNSILPEMQSVIKEAQVSRSQLEEWYIRYLSITENQNAYSGIVQDYIHSGRKAIEPYIANLNQYNLNYVPGFVFYEPVTSYFHKNLNNLSDSDDIWTLTDEDIRKFRIILDVTTSHLTIYQKYIPSNFDPSQLEKAILVRLQLQQSLIQFMSEATSETYGINE